jgi:phenylacetate-CoA ligase
MSLIISNLKKDNNFRSNVHIAAQVNETTEFKKRLRFLILSEFWSQKKQDAHQLKELKRIVSHAYKNIPYYRESFKKAGITPRDIGTLDDIERIPFLTRADIKENYDKLTPEHVSRKELLYRTTGGSTGDPLVIFSDLNFVSRDRANTLYYLGIAGLDPYKYKRVRLYGDKVPEKLVAQGKYWYEAHEGGQLIMSCYHINDKTILSYVDALRTFAPMYIHSRPSALYLLARHMKNMKVTLGINLEAVFCDGEILYEYQRRLIEDVFKTRLYLTYGHTEGAAVGVN